MPSKRYKPQTRIKVEMESHLISLYKSGMTVADLIKRFGCTGATIYRYLAKYGVSPGKPDGYTKEEKEYIANSYSNTPTKILAKQLNRKSTSIRVQAHLMGVKKQKRK